MKRKGMTPPSRAERVVRDLQSGFMGPSIPHHPVPSSGPGTGGKLRRRRRHSSDSSRENIANLMASPNLHARIGKV